MDYNRLNFIRQSIGRKNKKLPNESFTVDEEEWFMTEDRILWSKADEKTNLKKFRAEIRMVEDGVLSGFQNMTISTKKFYQHDCPLEKCH